MRVTYECTTGSFSGHSETRVTHRGFAIIVHAFCQVKGIKKKHRRQFWIASLTYWRLLKSSGETLRGTWNTPLAEKLHIW
jgi:hypothetical protein